MSIILTFLALVGLASSISQQQTSDPIQQLLNEKKYMECMDYIFQHDATLTLHHYYQVQRATRDTTSSGRKHRRAAKILGDFLQQYFQDNGQLPVSKVVMREKDAFMTRLPCDTASNSDCDHESLAPHLPVLSQQ